jgi:hypothetical protein
MSAKRLSCGYSGLLPARLVTKATWTIAAVASNYSELNTLEKHFLRKFCEIRVSSNALLIAKPFK